MKIFTYYIDIGRKHELELLEVWAKSWSAKGFDPVILGRDDAKKYKFYQESVGKLNLSNLKIMGHKLNDYDLACYERWMAYAALDLDDFFYVSDYDVFNNDFDGVPPELNKLIFFQNFCPSLAYGNSKLFAGLCELFCIQYSEDQILKILDIHEKFPQWTTRHNDQDFFILNFALKFNSHNEVVELANKYKILIHPRFSEKKESESIVSEKIFDPLTKSPKVSHLSSKASYEYKISKRLLDHPRNVKVDMAKENLRLSLMTA
jgi:hypothetical protein